jgi:hypothetical protein
VRERQKIIRLQAIALGFEILAAIPFVDLNPNGIAVLIHRPEAIFTAFN